MLKWYRIRAKASLILTSTALGAALMVTSAGAQDTWRTPPTDPGPQLQAANDNYRSYDDEGLITPTEPQPITTSATANWEDHVARMARLENQFETLQTTRVAELEAEIAQMKESMAAPVMSGYPMSGYGMCGTGCQPCCNQPCCPPVQRGFYAGMEFLFLKPHFENSTAFISSDAAQIANRDDSRSHDIEYDWDLSTRVVLGYTGDCGLGVRTRYFQYDHESDLAAVKVAPGGDVETPVIEPLLGGGQHFFMDNAAAVGFDAKHSLELQTWDWEVTNQLCFCRSLVTVGGGLRYVLMEQRYLARSYNTPAGTVLQESLYNMHDFEGIGPTLAINLLRPISCCSGLSLYFNGRGSALFGESSQYFKKVDAHTNAVTETFTRSGADNSLYIAEVGLGLQYNHGIFYARGGYEGQYWHGVGGPTTNQGNMGLHGLSLTLGLNY